MTMLVAIVVPWKTCSSSRGLRARELGQLPDALHRSLRGVVGRGRQLVDEDLAGLVVDVDQVGERPADIDAEAPHGVASGLQHDLAEVLAALHRRHRLARLLEREGLVDERRDLPLPRELEAFLDLFAGVDERADHALLAAEERDDVERDDLARVAAADHEAAVLRERVEAILEELAADVLEDEVDAAAVRQPHHFLDDVLRLVVDPVVHPELGSRGRASRPSSRCRSRSRRRGARAGRQPSRSRCRPS